MHHRYRLEESELSTLQIVLSGQQCRFAERVCLHTGMPGSCPVRLEGAGDGRLDILHLEACKGRAGLHDLEKKLYFKRSHRFPRSVENRGLLLSVTGTPESFIYLLNLRERQAGRRAAEI